MVSPWIRQLASLHRFQFFIFLYSRQNISGNFGHVDRYCNDNSMHSICVSIFLHRCVIDFNSKKSINFKCVGRKSEWSRRMALSLGFPLAFYTYQPRSLLLCTIKFCKIRTILWSREIFIIQPSNIEEQRFHNIAYCLNVEADTAFMVLTTKVRRVLFLILSISWTGRCW